MSIIDILSQLQDYYGTPNMITLFTSNTLFRSPMTASDSPKMLFYRIEQCQEIQCIRKLLYSNEQIIANAVHILIQAHIFPLKEFNTWEAVTPKHTQPSRRSSTQCMAAASQRWRFTAHPARTGMPTRRSTTSWRQGSTTIPMTTWPGQSRRWLH